MFNPLRIVAFIEGISYLVLLGIAMPLKYYYNQPNAVKIVGMTHGVLFVLTIVLLLIVHVDKKWKGLKTFLIFLSTLIPFGTFYADVKWLREGTEK